MELRWVKMLQNGLGKHGWIRVMMTVIARFGYYIYILYGIVEWFRPGSFSERQERQRSLLYCLFSVCFGSVISFIVGLLWKRKRPFVQNKCIEPLFSHKGNASFPSNHAALSFAAALQLVRDRRRGGWGLLFWSFMIGFSRIFCGIHYVSDVLGGFVLGLASHCYVVRIRAVERASDTFLCIYNIAESFGKIWRR